MRKLTAILSLVLVACLVLALGACGGNEGDNSSADKSSAAEASSVDVSVSADASNAADSTDSEESSEQAEDGKVTYTVTVTDADGIGMPGVMVQLCLDTCCPGVTDTDGVATFTLEAADYKVSVMNMPEGYTYATEETEFHFEEGFTSLTIALKTAE